MFCVRCGSENPGEARFCVACGKTMEGAKPGGRNAPAMGTGTEPGLVAGQLLADRFEVQKILGVGGMGRVYLALDRVLERPVAVKVLLEILCRDAGSVRRLVEEAKASIRLAHPNIVRIDDYHDAGTVKFLAMEYVEGETLADRLARELKLTETETRRIAIEICKGLEHAHANKVIHRDLKPANILIRKDGAIKIADFGIARVARDSVSRLTCQQDSGTLMYMSPEQLMGKSSEASDIYSVGVVLYEMLKGDPPFCSGDIFHQIRELNPEPLAGVSQEMRAIVMKCLEKKPERRFGDAGALREELDGAAEKRRREEVERERLAADRQRLEQERARAASEMQSVEEQRQREAEAMRRALEEQQRLQQRLEYERAAKQRERAPGPGPAIAGSSSTPGMAADYVRSELQNGTQRKVIVATLMKKYNMKIGEAGLLAERMEKQLRGG